MPAVAVLGLGRMGSAMARALSGGGVDLVLWKRSAERAEALAAAVAGPGAWARGGPGGGRGQPQREATDA